MQRAAFSFGIVCLLVAGCAGKGQLPSETRAKELVAVDEYGNRLTMRVEQEELDPKDAEGEVHLYTVFFRDDRDGSWKNLCAPDHEGKSKAIPLAGSWTKTGNYIASDSLITFACTSGVLAKCVRWGYKPWKVVAGRSLRDFHQACTRMARADYCGNGISHTQDGTNIDIYDVLGVQKKTPESGMIFEAAWGPEGAVYVNRSRWGEELVALHETCPERLKGRINEGAPLSSPESVRHFDKEVFIFNDSFDRISR